MRRLEQVLQGNRRSTELASSGDEGLGVDSRVSKRLSELESRVFGRSSASMELDAMMTDDSAEFGDCGDMVDVAGEGRSAGMMPFSSSMMWGDVKVDDVGEGVVLGDAFAVFGDCGVEFDVIGEGRWRGCTKRIGRRSACACAPRMMAKRSRSGTNGRRKTGATLTANPPSVRRTKYKPNKPNKPSYLGGLRRRVHPHARSRCSRRTACLRRASNSTRFHRTTP